MVGGTDAVIAVAPFPPGSFGVDTDFDIVTLILALDTGLGPTGSVTLLDLSSLLGPPALASDGFSEIPSNLSGAFGVAVPDMKRWGEHLPAS